MGSSIITHEYNYRDYWMLDLASVALSDRTRLREFHLERVLCALSLSGNSVSIHARLLAPEKLQKYNMEHPAVTKHNIEGHPQLPCALAE